MEASTLIGMIEQGQIVSPDEMIAFVNEDTDLDTLIVALGQKTLKGVGDGEASHYYNRQDYEPNWCDSKSFRMFQSAVKYGAVHQPDVTVMAMAKIGHLDRLERSWDAIECNAGKTFKDIFNPVKKRVLDDHIVPAINKVLGEYTKATVINYNSIPPYIMEQVKNDKMFIQADCNPATSKSVSLLTAIKKSDVMLIAVGDGDDHMSKTDLINCNFSVSKTDMRKWLKRVKDVDLDAMLNVTFTASSQWSNEKASTQLLSKYVDGFSVLLTGKVVGNKFVSKCIIPPRYYYGMSGVLRVSGLYLDKKKSEHAGAFKIINDFSKIMEGYVKEYMVSKQYVITKEIRMETKRGKWDIT